MRNQLDTLQIMRAFAAFLIVVFHSVHDVGGMTGFKILENPNALTYGIDLFFVISGFIMVYTAYDDTGLRNALHFFKRRLIRIVPLYWFYTLLLLALLFALPDILGYLHIDTPSLFKSLFFIPYEDHEAGLYPFLKLGWTLNYEMYFYLVFAVLLLFPSILLMPLLTAFFLVTVFMADTIFPEGVIRDFYGREIVLNFLIGAWIGFLFIKNIRLPSWAFYLGWLLVILSVIWLFKSDLILQATGYSFPTIIFAGATIAFLTLPDGSEDRAFPYTLVVMGDASYTLYLSHSFVVGAIVAAAALLDFTSPWILFGLCVFTSLMAAIVLYYLIEKPLLAAGKRLISGR